MMCYLDRTFCSSKNCKNECGRQFTKELEEASKKWWLGVTKGESDEAPIAFSNFCGEKSRFE